MKIAVACDGLDIAAAAATCSSFACYTTQSGVVTGCSNVPNMGLTPRERASILQQMGVDALIARQFTPEGLAALDEAGIEAVISNAASPREAADLYLYRTLMGEEGLSEKSIKRSLSASWTTPSPASSLSSSPKALSPRSHSPNKKGPRRVLSLCALSNEAN